MENRGKKVKEILSRVGIKIKSVAKILNKNETYIYQLLDKDDLSWDIIRKIGNDIGYDFRNDFPEMPFTDYPNLESSEYSKFEESLSIELDAKKWKEKYFKLLEDVSLMMREKKNSIFLSI